jgi:vitamin K-dependent gamma-carboxylase
MVKLRSPWQHWLFEPIDGASLAYFRMAFGAIMLWEVWRYFTKGWISRYWIDPVMNFTYYGFHWVQPLPGNGMYWLFGTLGVLSVSILIGWHYRLCMALFFLGFTYSFLLEQARYLNHFYLVCLISFLMIFIPAHRTWSVDAWRKRAIASSVVPAWGLWLLRAQLAIVYFYAGVAKLNPDWFRGEPLRTWLQDHPDFPLIGRWFDQEWMVYLLSYGGLGLDLAIAPLLFWRRTRWAALAFGTAFHLMNVRLFNIGIFPWFMIAATLLFLSPDWPRRLGQWLGARWGKRQLLAPLLKPSPQVSGAVPWRLSRGAIAGLLGAYLIWQVFFPLRHFLYPGNVNWTYEGHQYAWHMKLLSKQSEVEYMVVDLPSRHTWFVSPDNYLKRWQSRKIGSRPDLILQFAHFLVEEATAAGYPNVEVRANVMLSLNGRPYARFVDPTVNLAEEHRTLAHKPWVLPMPSELPETDSHRTDP